MTRSHAVLCALAGALALAGVIIMITLTGGDALWIGLAWAAASLVVAGAWWLLHGRGQRFALALGLLVGCVLLGWEGGLFMLPAVFVLCLDALLSGPRAPTRSTSLGAGQT